MSECETCEQRNAKRSGGKWHGKAGKTVVVVIRIKCLTLSNEVPTANTLIHLCCVVLYVCNCALYARCSHLDVVAVVSLLLERMLCHRTTTFYPALASKFKSSDCTQRIFNSFFLSLYSGIVQRWPRLVLTWGAKQKWVKKRNTFYHTKAANATVLFGRTNAKRRENP